MTKVLGSKLSTLWTRINTILVPRQATVTTGNGVYTVSLQNANTPTPDTLVSFDVPASSGGGDSTPIGTILDFAGSTAPTGYLICDGSAVSRTTYSNLFAVIGTTWGNGDGSTTFNLPNLCGRATIGVGTGTATDATAHTLGDTNGTETHLLTANESGIHEHNHADTLTFKLPNHAHGLANSMIVYNNASSNTSRMATSGSGTKISVNTNVGLNTENPTSLSNCTKSGSVTKHSGADATTSHNNMQPYATVNKIIKAL